MLKLGLAIPMLWGLPGQCLLGDLLLAVDMGRRGKVYVYTPLAVMPHDRARIQVVKDVIRDGVDYLMFVDADQTIPVGAFGLLMNTMQERKPAVVSGHYYRRGYPFTSVWSKDTESGMQQCDAKEGIHEIDMCGLGCALLDMKWMRENMGPQPWFEMKPSDEGTIVYDDVTFFNKVRALGGVVLGDARVRCGHLGFPIVVEDGNVEELRVKEIQEGRPWK